MCHQHYESTREWTWESDAETVEEDDELPEFLNEAGSDDVEILTDGGDES